MCLSIWLSEVSWNSKLRKNYHLEWVNQRTKWQSSIAILVYQRIPWLSWSMVVRSILKTWPSLVYHIGYSYCYCDKILVYQYDNHHDCPNKYRIMYIYIYYSTMTLSSDRSRACLAYLLLVYHWDIILMIVISTK